MSQNALNTVKKINGWDQYGKNWYKKLSFLSKKLNINLKISINKSVWELL